jgi:hypothetical protein
MKVSTLIDRYVATGAFDADSPGAVVMVGALGRLNQHLGAEHLNALTRERLAGHVKQVVDGGAGLTSAQLDVSMLHVLAVLGGTKNFPTMQEVIDAYQPRRRGRLDVEYQEVTVKQGDFGTKFLPLQNANREIDPLWARKMTSDWDAMSRQTVLVLYQDPSDKPGVFRIIDGQHRIYAASEWGSKDGTTFEAQIRKGPNFRMVDQVANLNLGKRYRTQDHLRNARDESLWPRIFAEHDLEPAFVRSGPKLGWPAIVSGFWMADGKTSGFATSTKAQLELWRTRDVNTLHRVDEAAQVLLWWKPACDKASSEHKLYTLHSAVGISFALRLWRANVESRSLASAPQRLLAWPHLKEIRELTAARGATVGEFLLAGVNQDVAKNARLVLPGKKAK